MLKKTGKKSLASLKIRNASLKAHLNSLGLRENLKPVRSQVKVISTKNPLVAAKLRSLAHFQNYRSFNPDIRWGNKNSLQIVVNSKYNSFDCPKLKINSNSIDVQAKMLLRRSSQSVLSSPGFRSYIQYTASGSGSSYNQISTSISSSTTQGRSVSSTVRSTSSSKEKK
jgi:hypothetical protein